MEIILVRIFLYSVRIQENKNQKKFRIWITFTQCLFRLPFPNRENTKNTVFIKNANVYEKLRGQYNFLKRFQNYIRCLSLCQVSSVWHPLIRIKQDVGNFIPLPNGYHWMVSLLDALYTVSAVISGKCLEALGLKLFQKVVYQIEISFI